MAENAPRSAAADLLDGNGFNQLARARRGYLLYNKNDIYAGRAIALYGEHVEIEAELYRQICRPGDVVVDVGANIGVFTVVFAEAVGRQGRVYAFEPQRVVFQTLCANVAINSFTNVECFHAAVGEKAGHVFIPDINYEVPSNFGGFQARQFDRGIKVPLVVLDEFLEVPRLSLIKADVEGMEAEVLRGARSLIARFRPLLYVENNHRDRSVDLINLIASMDYRLYWHLPPFFNPNNFAGNPKNVFGDIAALNMLCCPKERPVVLKGFPEVKAHEHPMDRGKPALPDPA